MEEPQQGTSELQEITLGDRTITLIGTAHISRASTELVERILREKHPETVAVELCDARYQSLKHPDRWKNTDIVSVIRKGKAYVLLAQLLLAAYQKKLGDSLGIKPGAEMMQAIHQAEELGAHTALADRDITVTLKRTWGALGLWSMLKVLGSAVSGTVKGESMSEEEIERLKRSDALDELMREFSEELPEVRTTLIDERDQYLAAKIASAPGKNIVAVLGAGHMAGVTSWLTKADQIDLAALETVPPPKLMLKLIGWGIPLVIVGMIIAGFFMSGGQTSMEMVWNWILITGSFAALGSVLAKGHPLTILTAFVAAPVTTLHPLLASGWIAGLVEAMVRKPKVSDLETVVDDLASWKGLWSNGLSRILLVMALTNLTGTVRALWGMKVLASFLH